MRHSIPLPSWSGRFILIGAAVLAGCRHSAPAPAPPIPTVTISLPLVRPVTVWDEYTGTLQAVDVVNVQARVSGYVESEPFAEGSMVKKGDLLVTIDSRPFQAQLDNALGVVAQAQATLQLAKNNLARAQRAGPAALSPEELDTDRQTVARDQGALATAQAQADAARLNVEWCHVTAPIAGRIGKKNVTIGNLITGGTAQSTLLTTITSVDPIYCYFDVDEAAVLRYKQLIREHKRASARNSTVTCYMALPDEKGFPHEGTIDFINNQIDPTTGTLQVRAVFPNPDGFSTPGMFARIRIAREEIPNAILVSDAAIGIDQNNRYLLTVGPNDVVVYRGVTLGPPSDGYRVISAGITPQDRVIVNGLMNARAGVRVHPVIAPMPAGAGPETGTEAEADTMPESAPATQTAPASAPAPQSRPVPQSAPATRETAQ